MSVSSWPAIWRTTAALGLRLSSATTSVPDVSLCEGGRQRSAQHVVIEKESAMFGRRLPPSTMTHRA